MTSGIRCLYQILRGIDMENDDDTQSAGDRSCFSQGSRAAPLAPSMVKLQEVRIQSACNPCYRHRLVSA